MLANAKLQGAILANAKLQAAILDGAQLQETILVGAQLTNAHANPRTTWPEGFDSLIDHRSDTADETES
jgi:uncharacterized protein YjbI with pentapeptide repeats